MLSLLVISVLNRTRPLQQAVLHHHAANQLQLLRGSNHIFLAYSPPSPTQLFRPAADECLSNPPLRNRIQQPIAAITKSKPLLPRGSSARNVNSKKSTISKTRRIQVKHSRLVGMPQQIPSTPNCPTESEAPGNEDLNYRTKSPVHHTWVRHAASRPPHSLS